MSASRRLPRGWLFLVIGFPLVTLVLVVAGVLIASQGGFAALTVPPAGVATVEIQASTLEHGEYLARVGGCVTCHTARGGESLAGGRAFDTHWGTIYSTNLTPDRVAGVGDWSLAEFRHAMTHGVSRHGFLYPAFPFQNFQYLDNSDIDAIFAWLQSQSPVGTRVPENRLDSAVAWRQVMLGWRMLFHRPHVLRPDPSRSPEWHRGRYLVEGLGHCSMCHGTRGAVSSLPMPTRLAGGRIPRQGWVAPALDSVALSRWNVSDLADYLRTGVAPQGGAFGPMAQVIQSGLQYLSQSDAEAMAGYLLELPAVTRATRPSAFVMVRARERVDPRTTALYEKHCADCHGEKGEGRGRDYPRLDGNLQVTAADPVNLIRVTLFGAAAPTTAGNPAPHTMPPFMHSLSDAELLAVLNHVRGSWSNDAAAISNTQLHTIRTLPLE